MDIWRYTRTGVQRYTAVQVQVHSYTQTGAAAQSGRHDRGVMGRTLDPRPCPSQLAMPCLSPSSNFSSYISFQLECLNAIIGLEIKWNPKPGPCQLLFPEITFCALGTQRFGSATNFGSVHYPKPTVSLLYSILLLKRQEDDTDAVEKKYVCRCSVFSV